ncbi:hypothetical protein ATEG_02212 [Aspergillus terreus NIH2624]|uniref:Probable feruloyl esterase B-1 n=1 Tax=Aspergillus terreus (strain NIH 2624 / FGSC A1156) TaxID=341663 RepID=FAEB1_ASPTN|nr:uncharacterized protein ATEG_02212 [Aspergillus terreus NIH2624]Q0CVS2.1 RecName: Full=Probable feruloyl esterase B-1; AltName: Full=Ferulic acid esterase B-1; Short=FAEB-1; Flags: Precursor [Aspergillus terreus NIH2624]EAU37174.1 hypothetical protein ATEG_02212 [Aspergillus terreus NIH2624]
MKISYFFVASLSYVSVARASQSFEERCTDFRDSINSLPNVQATIVEYVAGSQNVSLPDNDPSCNQSSQFVTADICRAAMVVKTSNSSQIVMEAWFPRNYTGRFLATGNGGFGGCIRYPELDYTTRLGFAAVATNNGHNGTSAEAFLNSPEVLRDFADRSIHTAAKVGKELTKRFYAEGFRKSYYLGCSTGGRQGFKSVQQYPHDFDGVVAGAPAVHEVNLISWAGHIYEITGNKSEETYLPPALWNIVHSEVMRQCDGLDGAQDNLIEDPDLCHPTFENIMCPSDNKSNNGSLSCITEAQANTVIQLMSPYYNTDGSMLFPGMQPGSETVSSALLYTGVPTPYAKEWFRYVVYNDTNWDPTTFNIKDAQAALKQNPFNIQTWEGDLSRFQNAGGKIITYHGMQDFLVSSFNSREYYKHVHETMGLAPDQLDEFYRYFRISGMAHCYYGDGASYIGGSAPSAYSDDPEDNVLMAMVEWVEKGIAPEFIRGTKLDQDGHPQYTRKHCRYPRRNVYRGPGSYLDENAWECVL